MKETEANRQSIREWIAASRFMMAAALITLTGVAARLAWLGLKPFHHDEGVNGYFLQQLAYQGKYEYDPTNYHGPDLYYISLFFTNIFGMDDVGTRASVAIFGILTVIAILYLRRFIGDIGALVAAGLMAISPGMVYVSRYFIHEILFVFFSLAIPIGIVFFMQRRKAGIVAQGLLAVVLGVLLLPSQSVLVHSALGKAGGLTLGVRALMAAGTAYAIFLIVKRAASWSNGTPIFLMLSAVSASMLFATKETAFITVGTMMISCVCVLLWERLANRRASSDEPLSIQGLQSAFGTTLQRNLLIGICVLLFLLVWGLFFSSFLTNSDGIRDSLRAYAFWTETGTDEHKQGFWTYLDWMWQIEAPILLLSVLGVVIALVKQRNRFVVFAAFWASGISLAYSIIPYKTPWLMVSFILPMIILAGHAVEEMFRHSVQSVRVLGALALTASIAFAGWQSWDLNFVRYDDDSMPYVYSHTQRSFNEMVARIHQLDAQIGGEKNLRVEVVSSAYWPLPWTLRNYKRVAFVGSPVPANGQDVIIARYRENEEEVLAYYQDQYVSLGTFLMRPSVDLLLLVRKDLAGTEGEKLELNLLGNPR
jgi:uncharacterized protein (TIGR03663 family)